jgi:methyl-accepting chemotaxis protein
MSAGSVDDMLARLRDPNTARIVANATGMSQAEAANELSQLSQRVEAARNNPAQAAEEVRTSMAELTARAKQNLAQAAADAKPEATATAWLTFAALVLSLLAAIAGASAGRRGVVRRVAREA